jgi:hypothetical protein
MFDLTGCSFPEILKQSALANAIFIGSCRTVEGFTSNLHWQMQLLVLSDYHFSHT